VYRASKALTVVQARDYYAREYSRGDYYEHDTKERKGEWAGRGAERLGLRGEVGRPAFHSLLEGRSPDGVQLIAAEAATDKHRAGWDFTASADKSVSIVALVGGDERVTQAHRIAVDRSLIELERHVQAKDRTRDRETTGEMVAAKFEHESSRALDPQLHTHVVVMNMTQRSDGEWRALEPREMFAAQRLLTATYRAEMARELQRIGYAVEVRADGSVGIAGFTKAHLGHFSQRRAQIESYLDKRGAFGAGPAERAARTTRRAKVRDIDRGAVVEAWQARARDLGLDLVDMRTRATTNPERVAHLVGQAPTAARESVGHAIAHVSERQAVFTGRDRDVASLVHGMGKVTLDDVRAVRTEDGVLIDLQDRVAPTGRFTTWETLRAEERNVALMRAGQGTSGPVLDQIADFTNGELSRDQVRVALHILTSRDTVLGVEGKAGTGKTHTVAVVRELAHRAGWYVRGFGPTTGAVKLLREAGLDAETVATLQNRTPDVAPLRRELWIVDEAGMLSTRQAATILEQAGERQAKVVLLGDLKQHAAVEAGRPFRYLQDHGLAVVRLDEIRRQTSESLRRVVKDASEGRTREAVARLVGEGRVIEVKEPLARHRAIADAVAKAREGRTLVVAPSHEERIALNRLVRERLIEDGRVNPESVKVSVTMDKGLTAAERRVARNYARGDRVRFTRGATALGLKPGAEGRVASADDAINRVSLKLTDGRSLDFDPKRVRGLAVATIEDRRLAVGDRVQFRAPLRDERVANGQLGTVREMDEALAVIELDGGRHVALDRSRPQPIDYGYATTSHAAQGQTVDRVLVCVDSERSATLVNQHQFYVSLSRAREEALVFTDDREALPRAVSRQAEKTSALDYVMKEDGHGTRPEPGQRRFAASGMDPVRAGRSEGSSGDHGRRPLASARGLASADRRGSQPGRASGGTGEGSEGPARAHGNRPAPADRSARAPVAAGLRERGEALGGNRGPLPDSGRRSLPPHGQGPNDRALRPAEGGRGRSLDRDGSGRGPRVVAHEPAAGHGSGSAADGAATTGGGRTAGHPEQDAASRTLSPLARLSFHDEEHRALQGVLPSELASKAVRVNVASRMAGGPRIFTGALVRELGLETVAKLCSTPDVRGVALAVAKELAMRVLRQPEVDRER